MGKLSLALRPLAETAGQLEAAIASGEIDVPAGADTAAEKKMLAEAAARPTASRSSATTGGDVSRFWVRSEEHTSELQSLMRISYAVFCLKKNTHTIFA